GGGAGPDWRAERADLGAYVVLGERVDYLARDDLINPPRSIEHEEDEGDGEDGDDADDGSPDGAATVDDATPAAASAWGRDDGAFVRRRRVLRRRRLGSGGLLVVLVSGHSVFS